MSVKINGRLKVKTIKQEFKNEFGLSLRLYDGNSFADEDATLASIRKGDNKVGEISPKKNMKVGNLEDLIKKEFGIRAQIASSDDSYLCENDLTLAKALEKDLQKKSKKVASTSPQLQSTENSEISQQFEKKEPETTEILKRVRIIIRNAEDPNSINECMFFDLFVEQLSIEFKTPLTIQNLSEISWRIFEDETIIAEIKRIISKYPINNNLLPQFWISRLNSINLNPLLEYHFDEREEKLKEAKSTLFFDNREELDDLYDSDIVFSVEGFGEDSW